MKLFQQQWVIIKTCFFLGHLFNKALVSICVSNLEYFIKVQSQIIFNFLLYLRDNSNLLFKTLTDIIVHDLIFKKYKYIINYQLLSIQYNIRLSIICQLQYLQTI